MEHLAELEGVLLAGELEITADEDEHAVVDAGGLAVNGGDGVEALLEGKGGELGDDVGGALDLLTLEGQHGTFLVEIRQSGTVAVEGAVVVLHKCLCQRVWIHLSLLSLSSFSLFSPQQPPISIS